MGLLAGCGTADITGEAAECGMLGYGKAGQRTSGIHTRLHARAFAFADGDRRLLLVVCELPLMSAGVVQEVLARLPDGYTESQVMITATHTHCGPGGYFHHALYNSNTGGFRERTYEAIVDGVVEAAEAAHADLAPAVLRLAHGQLLKASVNRSKRAFDRNPAADRAHFPDAIDPQTTLLRIERNGRLTGTVNWFATHNTSMTNTNTLISADNKGYAASHWEAANPGVTAAFAQTNAGDMSPNLNLAPGSGPTEDEFENTRIIGTRQYEAAAALHGDEIPGVLDARLTHVNLSRMTVRPEFTGDGRTHRTSGPVAGAAAFAGAWADGPGFRGFRPGRNPLWDTLSNRLVYPLAPRLRDAQAPKGLCLPAGPVNRVRPMVQERLPVQLLRIGPLYLIGLPAEITIVAGLRLRRTVAAITGADPRNVLVAGYSNAYAHYVTTPEEYDAQEYEGGSTLFGRWELPALCQTAAGLARAMRDGTPVATGTRERIRPPRRRYRRRGSDAPHPGRDFGDVLSLARTDNRITARFVGAHPGNDLRRGGTYLAVERREGAAWTRIADDTHWSTTFHWAAEAEAARASTVTVSWHVPEDTPSGLYRIRYFGDTATGPFTGTTEPFEWNRTAHGDRL
ncbi:neutral/alkaline non-lysosomal ceramidase N-terminal domain-containing protein [Streptomyces agglomeratus]|uniref:neutral/alkaline non-lysosomal ceramidase N-terminal domain-containing protein n=1 Tax=Streptomyces agglomeratus TaxID=285458 RepID=UPI0008541D40|nr:neutral/alkaline non-lysosomal ceramidase N-terminal domain-containing protein [Streptomyces agglomeratus]OEJ50331.1 alkaline ceramidase [Streptomyces agglomeratus]